MPTQQRNPGRILAPIAMVAAGLAVLLILASTGGGDDDGSRSTASKQEQRDLGVQDGEKRRKKTSAQSRVTKGVYVVKTGDTLGAIAERTGVTVERLQELNPTLDPQALPSGQRIKLR